MSSKEIALEARIDAKLEASMKRMEEMMSESLRRHFDRDIDTSPAKPSTVQRSEDAPRTPVAESPVPAAFASVSPPSSAPSAAPIATVTDTPAPAVPLCELSPDELAAMMIAKDPIAAMMSATDPTGALKWFAEGRRLLEATRPKAPAAKPVSSPVFQGRVWYEGAFFGVPAGQVLEMAAQYDRVSDVPQIGEAPSREAPVYTMPGYTHLREAMRLPKGVQLKGLTASAITSFLNDVAGFVVSTGALPAYNELSLAMQPVAAHLTEIPGFREAAALGSKARCAKVIEFLLEHVRRLHADAGTLPRLEGRYLAPASEELVPTAIAGAFAQARNAILYFDPLSLEGSKRARALQVLRGFPKRVAEEGQSRLEGKHGFNYNIEDVRKVVNDIHTEMANAVNRRSLYLTTWTTTKSTASAAMAEIVVEADEDGLPSALLSTAEEDEAAAAWAWQVGEVDDAEDSEVPKGAEGEDLDAVGADVLLAGGGSVPKAPWSRPQQPFSSSGAPARPTAPTGTAAPPRASYGSESRPPFSSSLRPSGSYGYPPTTRPAFPPRPFGARPPQVTRTAYPGDATQVVCFLCDKPGHRVAACPGLAKARAAAREVPMNGAQSSLT